MNLKPLLALALTAWVVGQTCITTAAAAPDNRFYEMRTYYAAPGKLEELNARFRNHTLAIFEKHGIQNIGYWMPVDNVDNKLIYILAFPSREAREKSWKEFFADPDWQKAQKASEANGKLVAKVDSIYLKPTDYSPALQAAQTNPPRLFELRTYTAAPGKLDDLNKRFSDHTLALFTNHGIANIGYWVPTDKEKGSDNTLIYLIAHKDKDSAALSWKAFGEDPAWKAARSASEVNGRLTTTNGVKSVYMTPTDYSPLR